MVAGRADSVVLGVGVKRVFLHVQGANFTGFLEQKADPTAYQGGNGAPWRHVHNGVHCFKIGFGNPEGQAVHFNFRSAGHESDSWDVPTLAQSGTLVQGCP